MLKSKDINIAMEKIAVTGIRKIPLKGISTPNLRIRYGTGITGKYQNSYNDLLRRFMGAYK